jgi:hypothetical protein
MSTHWTPKEFERHSEQLKKAVERLRKDERQESNRTDIVSANAERKRPKKKTAEVKPDNYA